MEINEEKKTAIVNAALEEFSVNTYAKASTNSIASKANVSKGIIFHYFKSKQGLFDYLLNEHTKLVIDLFGNKVDFEERDLFERLYKLMEYKLKVLKESPNILKFSEIYIKEKGIEEYKTHVMENIDWDVNDIYTKNIDYSLFKDDVDIPKAIAIVNWTLSGYSQDNTQLIHSKQKSLEQAFKDVKDYMDTLRFAYYKKESENE